MATWAEFEADAPEVAAVAGRLWHSLILLDRGDSGRHSGLWFPVAYLATVRRNGAPRVHPFCPILADGRLFAAIPQSSPKGWDIRRDPRCAIHALPGPDDDELCIRAHAHEVAADSHRIATVRRVVDRVGGMIESVGADPLFEFDLDQVDVAVWVDVGQPGTFARRQQWCANQS